MQIFYLDFVSIKNYSDFLRKTPCFLMEGFGAEVLDGLGLVCFFVLSGLGVCNGGLWLRLLNLTSFFLYLSPLDSTSLNNGFCLLSYGRCTSWETYVFVWCFIFGAERDGWNACD